MSLLSGGERGAHADGSRGGAVPGWVHTGENEGWTEWLRERETYKRSGHQPPQFVPLCFLLLFACPRWPGLPNFFSIWPQFTHWSLFGAILPPQLTPINTLFIPAIPTLLW